jgi:hypothetical protein
MAAKKKRLTPVQQLWVDARSKFRLSHAHIQMARELGLNPKKLGGLANDKQERWKSPLPQFIEELYHERFGRDRPSSVVTLEELAQGKQNQRNTQESTAVEPVAETDEDPFWLAQTKPPNPPSPP